MYYIHNMSDREKMDFNGHIPENHHKTPILHAYETEEWFLEAYHLRKYVEDYSSPPFNIRII